MRSADLTRRPGHYHNPKEQAALSMDRTKATMTVPRGDAATQAASAQQLGGAAIGAALRRGLLGLISSPVAHRRSALWHRLSLALLLVTAGLVLATFADYGVTWDEDVHN